MELIKTRSELRIYLNSARKKGSKIGFVPTMGALHPGHISLIERAKSENNIVVCSIFVNPTQFNNPADLERYPKTPEKDQKMLIEAGCDLLFLPNIDEMYPPGDPQTPVLNLGKLDQVMEGKHRPGHFQGVIQIVSRLFDVVEPDRSYFGQKDFQQLAVIREMVRKLGYHVQVIGCPIIRGKNGLAMSSRNILLSPHERERAAGIYVTLLEVKKLSSTTPVKELLDLAVERLASIEGLSCEYFEIADSSTLLSVNSMNDADSVIACVAVWMGKVRLIDNIFLK